MKTRSKDRESDKLPSSRRTIDGTSGKKTGKVTKVRETKTKTNATKNISKVIKLPLKDKKNFPRDISEQSEVISSEEVVRRSQRQLSKVAPPTITSQGVTATRSRGEKVAAEKGNEEQVSKRSKRQPKKAEDERNEEQIQEKSADKVDVEVKDMRKRQVRKAKTALEPISEKESDKSPVKKEIRLRKQTPDPQAGTSKGNSTNDVGPPVVPEEKKARRGERKRKGNIVYKDPVPEKRPTRARGKTPVQKSEASEIKSQPLRKTKPQKDTKNSEKQDAAEEKGKATGSRGEAKAQDSDRFESDTSQKIPLEVKVIIHNSHPQISGSDEELSDKENNARQNVSENSVHGANTSAEKKPIYKILGSKANPVALDQLIVMEDAAAGGNSGVYDFSLSQNGNGKAVKKKRKPRKRIVMPKKTTKKKIWDNKEVNRAKKKMTVTQMKMEKLESIPAHIREKVREKEKIKNRQSLYVSTPLRTVQRMDVSNVISPIHLSSITENESVERPASEIHEIDNDMDDSRSVENVFGDKTKVDSPRKDDVQPWRTDEAHPLPTISHVRHSDHDFLPTFSSDVIVKATPKKAKPPPRAPQTKSNDLDHSDPGPSSLNEKTFSSSPTSKCAENVNTEQNVPDKEDTIFNYTIENFFGFETENTLEVDEEVVQKHGEDALRKERERLKALVPPKRKVKIEKVTPLRRGKRVQQLTIKEAIPSTSREPPRQTPDDDIFEPERPERREKRVQKTTVKEAIPSTSRQPPKDVPDENIFAPERPEPRKSYSRPKARRFVRESSDDNEEEKPPQTVEEEGEEIMKKFQKKKKIKPKAKVGAKDLKQVSGLIGTLNSN